MRSGPRRGVVTDKGLAEIGKRLAQMRKAKGLTQIEMAQRLGVSQPIVSGYERGDLRLHGELIIKLARVLSVSADELLGIGASSRTAPTLARRWVRRIERIERLPVRDQAAVARTLDAFLRSASE